MNNEEIKKQQTKSEWTPEEVERLIKLVDTLAEKYITYKHNEAQADNKYIDIISKHNRLLTAALAVFLGVIVALMSYLTVLNKVSGDALLFLVGTITGYIILFIQRLLFGTTSNRSEPEDYQ